MKPGARPSIGLRAPNVDSAPGHARHVPIIGPEDEARERTRIYAVGAVRHRCSIGRRLRMNIHALPQITGSRRAWTPRPPGGASAGFTLVEAMVALVVLSVGMIGVAALHGQSLSAARSAHFRSIAVMLSADMADRIRVNRLAGIAYAGAAANQGCDPSSGGGIDCSPEQMAAHELHLWSRRVEESLPNGQWNVAYDAATTPPTYSITVMWDEVGSPVNPVEHHIALQLPGF